MKIIEKKSVEEIVASVPSDIFPQFAEELEKVKPGFIRTIEQLKKKYEKEKKKSNIWIEKVSKHLEEKENALARAEKIWKKKSEGYLKAEESWKKANGDLQEAQQLLFEGVFDLLEMSWRFHVGQEELLLRALLQKTAKSGLERKKAERN